MRVKLFRKFCQYFVEISGKGGLALSLGSTAAESYTVPPAWANCSPGVIHSSRRLALYSLPAALK